MDKKKEMTLTLSLYQNDLFVLIHGLSSSKDEWFTNHKELIDFYKKNSVPFIALDLYGHGSYAADEKDFNTEYINDDLWPKFIEKSVYKLNNTILLEEKKRSIKFIHIVSYSIGSVVAIKLATITQKCKSLSMAVPNPDYAVNDEYSLCNSINYLNKKIKIVILSGINDDDVPYEDVKRLITGNNKIIHHSYESGHSLPNVWIQDLLKEYE